MARIPNFELERIKREVSVLSLVEARVLKRSSHCRTRDQALLPRPSRYHRRAPGPRPDRADVRALRAVGANRDGVRAAREDCIADPEERLRTLMAASVARRHVPLMLDAFRAETEPTRFGLIQAMTRAAQSLGGESRFVVEALAGGLLE